MQIKLKTEYKIAEKKGKLRKHLKKFTFNFDENRGGLYRGEKGVMFQIP